jgi:hypothetical protein
MLSRSNGGGVTIYDAYKRCYGARAAYACAVTSHNNRRSDVGRCFLYVRAEAVFWAAWPVLRLYKGDSLKEEESQENGNTAEYNRE